MPNQPAHPSEADRERRRLIGEELIQLEKTKGWKILMTQLAIDEAAAKIELVHCDPNDTEKLEQLQREAKRYIWFRDTIHDLIAQGLDTMADQEPEEEDGRAEPEDSGDGA